MKKTSPLLILVLLLETTATVYADEHKASEPIPAILKSASELDYPPLAIVTPQGEADGYSVELLRAAVQVMRHEVTFKVGPWHEIKQELADGKLDVLPLVGRTPERELIYDFTIPYFVLHGIVMVRNNDTRIQNLADLHGKTIAVMRGDNAEEFARRKAITDKIVTTDSFEQALKQLAQGQYDAVIITHLVGLRLSRQLGLNHRIKTVPNLKLFRQDFSFAVREGNKDLLAFLNEGLALVMADGTQTRLAQKWLPETLPEPNYWKVILLSTLASIVVIGSLSWLWLGSLRKMVGVRTAELKESKESLALAVEELNRYKEHLEEQVQQRTADLVLARDAAKAANIAKSTFLATMSHELRTPLNAILGFSDLLDRDSSIPPLQKQTINIINRSGAHLLSMINDVLEISKIEAGRLELDNHAFDLIKLLEEISEMISVRAENKQLNFRLEIASNMSRYVKTDSSKLRQIIINLLGNAIKFTPQGEVILRASTQPGIDEKMTHLTLAVTDSGVGISTDKQSELFKPFVQLATVDSGIEGTGLGLAISKSLVELMGGQISVNSILGFGSTFKVELPLLLASADDIKITEKHSPVESIAPYQPCWRLLVVDDNPNNRLLLETMLTQVGFQIEQAENGQEAIDKFVQWQPHLIWMDMRMPVMDGYQASAKIRQLPNGDEVKIIAVTASVFKEQLDNILNAGCDAVIHKPFQATEIFAALNKYLGVKFIYQDQPIIEPSASLALTPEMLKMLPAELRFRLHQAALNLDIEETGAIINQIRNLTPDIAESLQKIAQGYQFEQIVQLIEAANIAR